MPLTPKDITSRVGILYDFYGQKTNEDTLKVWTSVFDGEDKQKFIDACGDFLKTRESYERLEPSSIYRRMHAKPDRGLLEIEAMKVFNDIVSCSYHYDHFSLHGRAVDAYNAVKHSLRGLLEKDVP